MNTTTYNPTTCAEHARYESPRSKLVLMGLGCLFLSAGITRQLHAESGGAHPTYASTTVRVGDLDLSTPGGVQIARDRIHAAARRMCQKVVDPSSLSHQPDYVQCVQESMSTALQQIPGPALVADKSGSMKP